MGCYMNKWILSCKNKESAGVRAEDKMYRESLEYSMQSLEFYESKLTWSFEKSVCGSMREKEPYSLVTVSQFIPIYQVVYH